VTTLQDRPNTALLVIDVQNGVVEEAYERDSVVGRIGALVERARGEQVPIVWVQHTAEHLPHGSEAWQIVAELGHDEREPTIEKGYGDAFEETALEQVLEERGIGRLLVVGAQSDQCIRSTLHGALVRGYDTTLVGDAHTTEDQTSYGAPPPEAVIAFTNLYWAYEEAPGRAAGVVEAADVQFGA
jgi:nicotinamidase-related amidase